MDKVGVSEILREIGGSRADALIKFGYVTKAGDYLVVEAILIGFTGDPATGDYTGLTARVVMTTGPLPRKADGSTSFSLKRVQQGEKIRAERAAAQPAVPALAGLRVAPAPRGAAGATHKQCKYAFYLSEQDGEGLGYGDFAEMSRKQVSAWIDSMLGSSH